MIRCTQIAAVKCLEVTEVIKKALSKSHSKTGCLASSHLRLVHVSVKNLMVCNLIRMYGNNVIISRPLIWQITKIQCLVGIK